MVASDDAVFFRHRATVFMTPAPGAVWTPLTPDQRLIQATLERQKTQRERVFSQRLPFSWLRLLVGVASVAFVLTDVPRSGLGINRLGDYYHLLEPDLGVASGTPWNYLVFRSSKEDAVNSSAPVWIYKLDTTSIAWRAFARHLRSPHWPACLLYQARCPSSQVDGDTVFAFVDALVSAIAAKLRPPKLNGGLRRWMGPPSLILRTENEYLDRVHDYVLPWMFSTRVWRTNQAIFIPSDVVRAMNDTNGRAICFGPTRPYFCNDLWINFSRSCPLDAHACKQVGHLYTHTMQRLRQVQAEFPTANVDLTFLESIEDMEVSRGSWSLVGYQRSDVSAIIRARTCSPDPGLHDNCETVFVEDYRYEIEVIATDTVQWYRILVLLRLVGQSYFFLRALTLVVSCYKALGPRLPTDSESSMERACKTLYLLSRVPAQSIVFGSPFPIACYTVAHCIDSALMYRMLEVRFVTQNGLLDLSVPEFFSVAVIQMRSVWVYALLLHLCVRSSTWHHQVYGVIAGVVGVPEFFLTAMSAVTIMAHFRSTQLRSTKLLSVREITRFSAKASQVGLRLQVLGHRGGGNDHLGGVIIDLKFLLCLVTLVAAISIGRAVFLRSKSMRPGAPRPGVDALLWPLGRTPVPYSADILWPTVSLCVHWTSDFFCIQEADAAGCTRTRLRTSRIAPAPQSSSNAGQEHKWRLTRVQDLQTPSVRMSVDVFRSIQLQMESLHSRSDEVEGNVAFMNLVLMSDPLVLFLLFYGDGARKRLAYYQSLEHPDAVLLLPEAAATVENEPMCHLRRMRRVYLHELHWSELVQCG